MGKATPVILAASLLSGCPRDKPASLESGASTAGPAATNSTSEARPGSNTAEPQASPRPRSDVARYNWRKQNLTDAELAKWLGGLADPTGPTSFDATDNQLTAAGVEALSRSKLGVFETLMLSKNPIGDAGAKIIGSADKFIPMRVLWLERTKLGPDGVDALLGPSSKFTHLVQLSLNENPIGDAGAEKLSKSEKVKTLSGLYLSKTELTDRGAKALAASPHLASLEQLDVTGNALTKEGIAALKSSPHFSKTTIDVDAPNP